MNNQKPTALHFCVLLVSAYWKLDRQERMNVIAIMLLIILPLGFGTYVVMDAAISDIRPKARIELSAMQMPAKILKKEKKLPKKEVYQQNKSDTAPTPTEKLSPANTEAYIAKWKGAAIRSMRKTAVPASITLAQGIVESNSGKSSLALDANNHFGIKCFSKHCKKGHCVNKADDSHKDFFRKYKSAEECFTDHGNKISTGRYKKLKRYGMNYRKWAVGLKLCGYATDGNYANILINTIERYNLHKFDN
jgi:flagellum-specific peptidoglycan hydrolase FlgJ